MDYSGAEVTAISRVIDCNWGIWHRNKQVIIHLFVLCFTFLMSSLIKNSVCTFASANLYIIEVGDRRSLCILIIAAWQALGLIKWHCSSLSKNILKVPDLGWSSCMELKWSARPQHANLSRALESHHFFPSVHDIAHAQYTRLATLYLALVRVGHWDANLPLTTLRVTV